MKDPISIDYRVFCSLTCWSKIDEVPEWLKGAVRKTVRRKRVGSNPTFISYVWLVKWPKTADC